MRLACAEVRALFLDQAGESARLPGDRAVHRDGRFLRNGAADRAGLLDACRRRRSSRQGDRHRRAQARLRSQDSRANSARLDLAGKGVRRCRLHPRHEARRHGARARRAPAASRRDDRLDRRDSDPPRRQGTRSRSSATAISSRSSAPTRPRSRPRARPPAITCAWDDVEPLNPFQEEARWLLQRPVGRPRVRRAAKRPIRRAGSATRRPIPAVYIAHASIAPSCGLALYRDGKLTVWTHCAGRLSAARRAGARP